MPQWTVLTDGLGVTTAGGGGGGWSQRRRQVSLSFPRRQDHPQSVRGLLPTPTAVIIIISTDVSSIAMSHG